MRTRDDRRARTRGTQCGQKRQVDTGAQIADNHPPVHLVGLHRAANSTITQDGAMPEAPLRLYADAQFASPYAMSVFVALQEKQLTFELFAVDLGTGANRAERYAVESLIQRVPTLAHGDFALSESTAITEYLGKVCKTSFQSADLLPLGEHQL
jgi:hypothetical protein